MNFVMHGWPGVKNMGIQIPEAWREKVKKLFPDLEEGISLEFTSEVDYNYNCLSWALGCNSKVFEKSKGAFWAWPNIADDTVEGWGQVCEVFGFAQTETTDFVIGHEKIAIFTDDEGSLHAARSDKTGL
jgi:hypothetical protein